MTKKFLKFFLVIAMLVFACFAASAVQAMPVTVKV